MSDDPLDFLKSPGVSGSQWPIPGHRYPSPKESKPTGPLALAIGIVVAIVFFVWFIVASISRDVARLSAEPERSESKSSPEEIATVRTNATRLMKDAQAAGIIGDCKMEDDQCEAWVTPLFYELDFSIKIKTAAAIWSWAFTGRNRDGILTLRDSQSGKDVGTYSIYGGGLSMK